MRLADRMTAAGTIQLPLMIFQIVLSIGAAWAGIRIVDDVKSVLAWREARGERENR